MRKGKERIAWILVSAGSRISINGYIRNANGNSKGRAQVQVRIDGLEFMAPLKRSRTGSYRFKKTSMRVCREVSIRLSDIPESSLDEEGNEECHRSTATALGSTAPRGQRNAGTRVCIGVLGEYDQIVPLTGKEMQTRRQEIESIRDCYRAMNRLARVLGTICVGYSTASRLVAETARLPKALGAGCTPPNRTPARNAREEPGEYCALSETAKQRNEGEAVLPTRVATAGRAARRYERMAVNE